MTPPFTYDELSIELAHLLASGGVLWYSQCRYRVVRCGPGWLRVYDHHARPPMLLLECQGQGWRVIKTAASWLAEVGAW